jgi:hypothetical protein
VVPVHCPYRLHRPPRPHRLHRPHCLHCPHRLHRPHRPHRRPRPYRLHRPCGLHRPHLLHHLRRTAAAALCALCALSSLTARADDAPGGELRLSWTERGASAGGPLADANRRSPGIAPPPADSALAEAELRHTLRFKPFGTPLALSGNLLLQAQDARRDAATANGRVNELNAAVDLGAWQLVAGKKVVAWDVGYGFRPNDVVQQETRRTLLATTPEGRPLLQLEHFGAESALSLVWVNPQRVDARHDTDRDTDRDASRGAAESALALRAYRRLGALDAFGFARLGAHTGGSVGAALSWVATDAIELHASWRALQRHDAWRAAPGTGGAPAAANPWRLATLGGTSQWLLGGTWTGEWQQSLLFEAWHDGTALPDRAWDAWQQRNRALAEAPGPALRGAANLAWQATPFAAPSLRRDNLFVRLSWQPERWQLSADTLYTPADHGRLHTLAAQWQGERWRLNAAWRMAAGPADAVVKQLPTRRSLLLAATRSF